MPNVFGFNSGSFGDAQVEDAANDLLVALCTFWGQQMDLVAVSPILHYNMVPDEVDPPYAVLSLISGLPRDRNTGRGFGEDRIYQFAVYSDDQDEAVELGAEMVAVLDTIQDAPLVFARGYQRAWFWAGQHLVEVPGRSRGGLKLWQQAHKYKMTIGRVRGGITS